jgi:glycyl-tRNA synthetase beta chain
VPGALLGQEAAARPGVTASTRQGRTIDSSATDYLEATLQRPACWPIRPRRDRIRSRCWAPLIRATLMDPACWTRSTTWSNGRRRWLCTFDAEFLAVPHEALVASMQDHQKFFRCSTPPAPARVSNRFVAVANLDAREPDAVREGFERVIRPRLADARFFLEQDQKAAAGGLPRRLDRSDFPAEDRNRWRQIETKNGFIIANDSGTYRSDPAACERAGQLAKCDLMTQMVGEFPELQGLMGRHYALPGRDRRGGRCHRRALRAGLRRRPIPASASGPIVSAADRADTLVGIFAAGQRPPATRTRSPAPRALGLVRTLLEARWPSPLNRLLALAANELWAQG